MDGDVWVKLKPADVAFDQLLHAPIRNGAANNCLAVAGAFVTVSLLLANQSTNMVQTKASSLPGIDRVALLIIMMLLAVMVMVYSLIATHNHHSLPPYTGVLHYGMLGKAFMTGQIHLSCRLADESLYNGKYYLYFGPVPALLPWIPVRYLAGVSLGDPFLILFFSAIGSACLTLLLASIALHQRMLMRWELAFAILSLCFGTWVPFLVSEPFIFQVAISGAYCFSALGLLCLWEGFWCRQKAAYCLQLLAGLCFGLAMGCRITHVFAVVILITAWLMMRRTGTARTALLQFLCLFGPWLLCLVGLAIYNYVRFDSIFETGMNYQFGRNAWHTHSFLLQRASFDFDRDLAEAYRYLLRPLAWNTDYAFPFCQYERHNFAHPPTFGLFTNSPFSLWLFAMPYCWVKRRYLLPETRAILAGVALYSGIMLCFLIHFLNATMRFEVDWAPWLMLVACILYLQLLNMAKTRRVFILLLVVGGATAFYSTFTGTIYVYVHSNPPAHVLAGARHVAIHTYLHRL